MLGNGRLEALCFDGSKRLANVRISQTTLNPYDYAVTLDM